MEHKHKGVERSTGTLRSHPIERQHKDDKVKTEHNKVLGRRQLKYKQYTSTIKSIKKIIKSVKTTKKPKTQKKIETTLKTVLVPVTKDNYLTLDLTKTKFTGVCISFTRRFIRKGRKIKRSVHLQIENE